MLPKALKSRPKSNKSPNLVTLPSDHSSLMMRVLKAFLFRSKFSNTLHLSLYIYFNKMGHPRPLLSLNFDLFKCSLSLSIYKCPFPASFFVYLRSFPTKKCTSSIWCHNTNPKPLQHESSPIITRPGLPPFLSTFYPIICSFSFTAKSD